MAVFQGRGGMELIDVLRAGCVGMIPSVESCHVQSRIFDLMRTGRAEDEARPSASMPSWRLWWCS